MPDGLPAVDLLCGNEKSSLACVAQLVTVKFDLRILRRMMKLNGGVRIGNDDPESRMAATIMRLPPAAKGTLATFRIVVTRGPPHHAKRQGCS